MKVRLSYVLYGTLVAIAVTTGLASSTGRGEEGTLPSVSNPAAAGAEVLKTYLAEKGYSVEVWRESSEAHAHVRTRIIVAPSGRPYSQEEVEQLKQFVEAGGRLVYLAPRDLRATREPSVQPDLDKWLRVKWGKESLPLPRIPELGDVDGADLKVILPLGPLHELTALRVSQEPLAFLDTDDAIALTEPPGLWFRRVGNGEVWLGSGPDLAQSKRLDLGDNLTWWERLAAQGPIAFDESHLLPPVLTTSASNVWAFLAQLLLVGVAWAYAKGKRMAPPRSRARDHHRSTHEYISAMAGLLKRGHVERELLSELRATTQRSLAEALGVSPQLPVKELAREFALRTGRDEAQVMRFFDSAAANAGAADASRFFEASRQAALLEAAARGKTARRSQLR